MNEVNLGDVLVPAESAEMSRMKELSLRGWRRLDRLRSQVAPSLWWGKERRQEDKGERHRGGQQEEE